MLQDIISFMTTKLKSNWEITNETRNWKIKIDEISNNNDKIKQATELFKVNFLQVFKNYFFDFKFRIEEKFSKK